MIYKRKNEKKDPVISIITPYYNAGEYIEQTAKSVLNQTFTDFEWIIVDDGSEQVEQEKLKEIEKIDNRIKVYKCASKESEFAETKSLGPAQARDFGIRNSSKSTKYIVFLDADDIYNKTFLECCYWTLETHPKVSWAYTDSINFGVRNFLWRKWYDVEWEKKENILIVSACVRKDDLLEVGGFGIKEKKIYEDWYLWLKLIKAGKYPIRMNSLLTYYRQKQGTSELKESNNSNRKNALKIINEVTKDITYYKDGIQFPKYDYNWDKIEDQKIEQKQIKKKNKKINILMILPWMVTGGADRFNLDLVSKMDKRKFDFTIITTLPSKNEWRRYFEKYAKIYDLTTFLDMKDWTSFVNYIIKKNNINLIFNSNSEFGYKILPYLKAKHPNIPIVDYVHMEEWYWKNGGFSRESSMVQNVIDKTFTCNENSRKIFIEKFNRKSEEVKTMYIGVDEKRFNPNKYNRKEILKELNNPKIEQAKYVISYICRITEQKRPYLFLEIIKKLAKQRDDFIAVVCGDGPMLEEMKKIVQKDKLNKYFVFLGNYKETEKIYKISDISLNTSIKEGLALTSYESLAMEVPVISADVGGQKELITEFVGIVVPCMQDEKEILDFNYSDEEIYNYVEAIENVLQSLMIYKSNCRNRILDGFTLDKMIKSMENELTEIAKNPNKEKIELGTKLSKNTDILKELISTYFASCKPEYEWLVEDFNKKNIHKMKLRTKGKQAYEQTLGYKIKHPIVVALRKIGIYENVKNFVFKSEY